MSLTVVALLVFVVNLPFGFWRAGVPVRSRAWFLAIHLPVPIVIALRILGDIGFAFWTYPVMIGAFALGQWAGGRMRRRVLLPG
jgi:hypothetical protein